MQQEISTTWITQSIKKTNATDFHKWLNESLDWFSIYTFIEKINFMCQSLAILLLEILENNERKKQKWIFVVVKNLSVFSCQMVQEI